MILDSPGPNQCFLVLGDNTSGLGWMIQSGKLTPKSPYFHAVTFVARFLASLLLQHGHCLARQHIQGKLNTVPDLLSFVGDQRVHEEKEVHPLATENTTDAELTAAFHQFLPQLIPPDFRILPLPEEVSSFVIRALQIAESTMTRRSKPPLKAKTEHGDDGEVFVKALDSTITQTSILYPPQNENSCSEASSRPFAPLTGTDQDALLEHVRSRWDRSGCITGTRKIPVGGKTVRTAASNLASAFRNHVERSPLHVQGTNILRPAFRDLLTAFDNLDPPPWQKAITPRFLRYLHRIGASSSSSPQVSHAVDLIIGAFFFACRSCEYVVTPTPGVTRRLKLRNLIFRDKRRRVLRHDDHLPDLAVFVTVCFETQKNRQKMERRTHRRTRDPALCPVRRFAAVTIRIIRTIPDASPDTDLCTVLDHGLHPTLIDNKFTLSLLRQACSHHTDYFGFAPADIGNKSLRSGAAMALFLAHTSPDRIMLMGRWKSLAFMAYIRPQVFEWSIHLTDTMIKTDNFLDLNLNPPKLHSNPCTRIHHHGRPIQIETFNVNYDWTETEPVEMAGLVVV